MSGNMLIIPREELEYERHLPSFQTSPDTRMTGYKWNRVRVTFREASSSTSVLARELRALSGLSHPQLLLGVGPAGAGHSRDSLLKRLLFML